MPESPSLARRLLGHPLLWPVLALVVLLAVNVAVTPSFLNVRMQDGHLYGNVIDIMRNSAPVMLVALGMTLVIATRGIDLSVGAIAAIAAAVACTRIIGAGDEAALSTAVMAMTYAVVVCIVLGAWNGLLVSVLGIQPIIATLILMVAGRGISMAITDGQITTVNNPWFSDLASGFVLTLPVAFLLAVAVLLLTALLTRRTALGMLIEAVGINPEASPAGRRTRADDHLDRLRLLRAVRRTGRPGDRGQHQLGQRQQPRAVDRARRDPRRRHRRHLPDGRALLAGRHLRRRALHRHARPHDPQHRDPLGGQLPLQGGRRDRRVPPPVAARPAPCCASADRSAPTRPREGRFPA